jgi:GNAT superfamily N-acetyltransferase
MLDDILLRPPLAADHQEIAALIAALIPRYLGRGVTDEGIAILREDIDPGVIGAKLGGLTASAWSPAFVAIAGARIVGFGAVRNQTHITQLHVVEEWHGRGIGHRIAQALAAEVAHRNPNATEITLNAAAGALEAYMRMGFVPAGPRWHWRGIAAQPMVLRLDRQIRVSDLIQRKAPGAAIRDQ